MSKPLQTYAVHFCGIGGACHGIEQAGLKCKVAVDYLALAVEYREKNLRHRAIHMDIAEYQPLPEHASDVLWTSPSCQTFSTSSRDAALARERSNVKDKRDMLYLASLDVVKEQRPRFVVLENVTGLMTKFKGEFFRMIIQAFKNLGYHTEFNVMNSRYWLPQDRERLFIVASRDGQRGLLPHEPYREDGVYPKFGSIFERGRSDLSLNPCSYKTIIEKVARLSAKNGQPFPFRLIGENDVLPTVTCGFGGGITRAKTAVFDEVNDLTGKVAFLRHVSAREGARAQGFPDSWELPAAENDAWTLVGNAVSSPVSKAILDHLQLVAAGEAPEAKRAYYGGIPSYIKSDEEVPMQLPFAKG